MTKNIIETFLEHKVESQKLDTDKPTLLVDDNKKVIDLEAYQDKPCRIKHEHEFDDLRGFVDYVNDFKTESTTIFAGREKLIAIMDFHYKTDGESDGLGNKSKIQTPNWCKHKITYNIKRSNRWDIWQIAHNNWMNQREFAEFLDSGLNEITDPKQSEILDLVKNFRATVNYDVNCEETAAGTNFSYSKQVKGSAKKEEIQVPEHIIITLQPFDNLSVLNPRIENADKKIPAYSLRAKINWRMNVNHGDEQSLQFKVQILNFENAVDETLESIRIAINELTNVRTYIG